MKESVEFKLETPSDDDALPLAKMHVQSWLDSYPGTQPGMTIDYVKKLTKDRFTDIGLLKSKQLFKAAREQPQKHYYKIARSKTREIMGLITGLRDNSQQELQGLYVAEKYKGTGVSQTMFEAILKWFDKNKDIYLWVSVGNDRAVAFYYKNGFREVSGSEKFHRNDNVQKVVKMIRKGNENEI